MNDFSFTWEYLAHQVVDKQSHEQYVFVEIFDNYKPEMYAKVFNANE